MINEVVKDKSNIDRINYNEAFELVKAEVDRTLSSSPRIIRSYTSHLAKSTGKFIRAQALLICAEDKDGLIHPDAVKLAASIEVLHLATLVHDDIIDNAEIRRGEATLQKKYGRRTAVICGDFLLCTALKMSSSITDKQDYLDINMPDYIGRVCLGELNQHINNGNFDLSVRQYLKIISGKTAALFEASFFAGATMVDRNEIETKKYAKIGRYIGMIFQLTDDCMDFETTVDVAQKPVQSDFEQNVITLPLIHAFRSLVGLKDKARSGSLTRSEINEAVAKTGGLTYTRFAARKYYNKATELIALLDATEDKKAQLILILNKAYRNF